MTTNGATLASSAAAYADAGLSRVNISIDSLRRDRFLALTRRDQLDDVLAGIEAAVAAGLHPVKLNVVCMRGVNDDEVVDLATFGRDQGVEVRFIEWMPLDEDHTWSPTAVVPGEEIIAAIAAVHPLHPLARGSAPAEVWAYDDGRGTVGAIASVTEPFCGTCDRIRLTAEGALRSCLFSQDETDLRALLRGGGSDQDLADAMASCVGGKLAGHQIGQVTFVQPPRSMSRIGG
jgi:cyclic pyranopterin phosphate synthase